ncbi:MAG TPA: TonB-dependent receptor plug domain-containing protein, partial [Opitutaceae bacterium]|nr:TonB-dependent receptor plug domain-containing protein [Opitutaceae bacterium]
MNSLLPPRLARFSALLALAAASALAGRGQTASNSPTAADDETVQLPAFSVTGTSADPYQAQEEMSASRTAAKIIDTPMTVDVITPALMADLGPDTIYSAAQYFAGVSPGRGTGSGGINDRMTFRGFESFSRTVDNFSGFLFPGTSADDGQFDPAFVEHAELLMGPDSILAPTGAPGGSINVITKSPQFTPDTWVSAEFGEYDANKYVVDSTGPIGDGKHMAYRVIADYQDSMTYLPGANLWFSGAAEFTYKFTDTSKITFKYFGSQETYKGTATLSNLDGEYVYTPNTVGGATISDTPQPGFTYDGWNGDASWSYRTMRDNTAEVELTSALTDHINMRLAGQIYLNSTDNVMGFPSASVAETWNQQTGVETGVTAINPASLATVG